MVLIFLGSWRNTLVVGASIKLSIFAGVDGWNFNDQTNNLMTSGGMAIGIGMIVDKLTVLKENIKRK